MAPAWQSHKTQSADRWAITICTWGLCDL